MECQPQSRVPLNSSYAPMSPIKPAPAYSYSSSVEWKYEMRRHAQEIIPGLYLGPFQSSTNLDMMNSLGITHVLCIRDKKEAALIYPRFPTEFRYMTLDISDKQDQNIITIFPQCCRFIEEALNQKGVVLAHCNGGIATAPAIVIGYLMWKYAWTYDDTLSYVQTKRYCVSPISFSIQLREYEPITLAQKMLQQAGATAISRTKRSHVPDSEATEEEMAGQQRGTRSRRRSDDKDGDEANMDMS